MDVYYKPTELGAGVGFVQSFGDARGKQYLSQASEELPKFNNPPVAEVAIGVQFSPLAGMHIGHFGLLWECFKEKFPRVEQQQKLPHVVERRGIPAPLTTMLTILSPAEMIPRVWFLSNDNSQLIQVQNDRFTRNWRRYHSAALRYPSYDAHNRPEFIEDYSKFAAFVEEQKIGALIVDQCEMVYINHILPSEVWSQASEMDRVFKGWSLAYPSLGGTAPNLLGCRARHELKDDRGGFLGHLYVELDSGFQHAGSEGGEPAPLLQLQLTVRGKPTSNDLSGVMQFMDFAHRVIVKSFADVTTPRMHRVWERIQ